MIQIFSNSYGYRAIWTTNAGNRQGVKHGANNTFSNSSFARAKSKIREYALTKILTHFVPLPFPPVIGIVKILRLVRML